jgi:phosphate transport system substrate-binding protein
MKYRILILSLSLVSSFVLSSCGSASDALTQESTTRGNIRIGVDDSYKLLLETEISTFQSLYPGDPLPPGYCSQFHPDPSRLWPQQAQSQGYP